MPATNDTPLKRFTAFWFVLGAFLLFGIIALFLGPMVSTPEVTAADEAGATRRLAVRDLVEQEQAAYLARAEKGDKLQVPPAEVFSLVGAKLAATKPQAVKDEKFRDPAAVQAEAAEPAEKPAEAPKEAPVTQEAEAKAEVVPAEPAVVEPAAAEAKSPASAAKQPSAALIPRAPRPETTPEPAEPTSL